MKTYGLEPDDPLLKLLITDDERLQHIIEKLNGEERRVLAEAIARHAPSVTPAPTGEPGHTCEQDFDHFLSYSGLGLSETPVTIEKLFRAFFAAWSPAASAPAVQTDAVWELRELATAWQNGEYCDPKDYQAQQVYERCAEMLLARLTAAPSDGEARATKETE